MGSDIVKRLVTRPRLFMPGDSGLMRQICYQPQESPDRSSLSDIITDFIRRTPASAAVRKRTQYIGDLIKSNAKVHAKRGAKDFTVLGIACGECVELAMVGAFPVTYYGNDLDPTALRNAQDIYGIKPLAGDYRVVIRDLQKAAKKFDFITIAGISNYIPTCDSLDSSGKVKSPGLKTIISDLYDLLNNGGTLLVTNFMTGCKERGFMEATMKWNLIYRTVEDMTKLGTDALAGKPLLKEVTVKSDSQERIVYLRISKNGVPPINEDVPLFRTPA
jgi:2-polyprenyl-3-methyl-5-hydroxy-6-metoxy-1,4-benzoquinol methylase